MMAKSYNLPYRGVISRQKKCERVSGRNSVEKLDEWCEILKVCCYRGYRADGGGGCRAPGESFAGGEVGRGGRRVRREASKQPGMLSRTRSKVVWRDQCRHECHNKATVTIRINGPVSQSVSRWWVVGGVGSLVRNRGHGQNGKVK